MRLFSQFLDLAFPEALQYERRHSSAVLHKGIKLITEPFPSPFACVGVLFDVGSKNDGSSLGLANLSAKMLTAGTKQKPAEVLSREMDRLGIFSVNTTRDLTWVQALCLKENLNESFKLICEMVCESVFPSQLLDQMKSQVLIENERMMEIPKYMLIENLHSFAFRGHPMGNLVAGTEESLSKITRAEIAEFVNANYCMKNTVVSAAGAVNFEHVKELVERLMWRVPDFEKQAKLVPPSFNSVSILQNVADEKSYIALAFPAASFQSDGLVNFQVLENMIKRVQADSNSENNFFQTAVQFDGLINTQTTLQTYSDCGLFTLILECLPKNLEFIGAGALKTFNRLSLTISEQELSRGKNLFFTSLLQKDSMAHICQQNANHLRLFGKKITKSEYAGKVLSLDSKSLSSSISEWVSSVYPVIAVYGNVPDPDIIEKMYQIAEK